MASETQSPDPATPTLTARQLEVLEVMARGLTNREIGEVLGISAGTVRVHVAAILEALGVANRTEATDQFHRLGIGTAGDTAPVGSSRSARPSIAVLPLTAFGDGSDLAPLADGIAEDLITRLSRWDWFPVAARSSSFALRDSELDASEVSRRLGVRYVLDGSVRASGDRIRVTMQLVEGETGQNVWAQHYDRELGGLFEVQDAIVDTIVATLGPGLMRVGGLRIIEGSATSESTWDLLQQAMAYLSDHDGVGWERAAALADQAIALDDELWLAYGIAFYSNLQLHFLARCPDERSPAEKLETYSLALEQLDPHDPWAPTGRAMSLLIQSRREEALEQVERAVALAPRFIYPVWVRAILLAAVGRLEESLEAYRGLHELAPEDPLQPMILVTHGIALSLSGAQEESDEVGERAIALKPGLTVAYLTLSMGRWMSQDLPGLEHCFARILEQEPRIDPRRALVLAPPGAEVVMDAMLDAVNWPNLEPAPVSD